MTEENFKKNVKEEFTNAQTDNGSSVNEPLCTGKYEAEKLSWNIRSEYWEIILNALSPSTGTTSIP